jgi:hypothetical protein
VGNGHIPILPGQGAASVVMEDAEFLQTTEQANKMIFTFNQVCQTDHSPTVSWLFSLVELDGRQKFLVLGNCSSVSEQKRTLMRFRFTSLSVVIKRGPLADKPQLLYEIKIRNFSENNAHY